jgi:hypothetical protein
MASKVSQTTEESANEVGNGIKLLGEIVVPGASQFIDGNVKKGGLHLLGGIAALAFLGGPTGILVSTLVRGNSFTRSTLDKSLYSTLFGERERTAEPATGVRTTT